jgi:hypothetical protein
MWSSNISGEGHFQFTIDGKVAVVRLMTPTCIANLIAVQKHVHSAFEWADSVMTETLAAKSRKA